MQKIITEGCRFNTLRPRHFADDSFKCIFLNENVWIRIKISLKFVPKGPINNISAMVQIMALRRPGDKPLSEPMVVSLPTHTCVARPRWINCFLTINECSRPTPWFQSEPNVIKSNDMSASKILVSHTACLKLCSKIFFYETVGVMTQWYINPYEDKVE